MPDSDVIMDKQIKSICHSTTNHIRNISAFSKLIPEFAAAQLVHSLVTPRLDNCNSLLYGIPDYKRKQLQRIQNIAARIVTLTPCSPQYHITEVLNYLRWLPVKNENNF